MRKQLGMLPAVAGLMLIYSVGGATLANAETRVCNGTIGPISLDNIVVQDGSTCVLKGTRLKGNIVVLNRATLSANRVRVNGNIQSEGAAGVFVNPDSVVGGNIQIKQGNRARVDRVRIGGDLQVEQNRGFINLNGNEVDGNLQAFQNRGGIRIALNIIEENLQCKENFPRPTGGDNIAGSKEDQCARL